MAQIPKLLLEKEAAARLGCHASTVKRLRLSRRLAYIPGRPVLITEPDLQAYIDRKRGPAAPEPGSPEAIEKMHQDIKAQVRRKFWLKRCAPASSIR